MQDAADLHDVGFSDAVQKQMPRLANPGPGPASARAAKIEMIGSAMLGDFWPLTAASSFGILRDLLNRGRNEFCVTLQGLRAKILFRPDKDARDVTSRLRGDDDVHSLTRGSGQLLS